MSLFELGDVVMTSGVAGIVEERDGAFEAVLDCLQRHASGDWGGAPATGHKHCQMWHWITTEIQLPICLT
ncbi:MAG: hypothetical protein IKQ60_02350 [Candidatus Methanomethylophilaceae archaeon]|nr:hypothetical protein [Candidatus Methanomethylophilaceae archaeon]